MRNAMRDKHKMCRVKIPIRGIGANVLGLPTSNVLLGEALQLRIASLYSRAACFTSCRKGTLVKMSGRGSTQNASGFLETGERAICTYMYRGSIESEERVQEHIMRT